MATWAVDDCDGVFTETGASLDEVDSSRVIQVTKELEIPDKYFLRKIFSPAADSLQSFQRASERPVSYRMVHKDWGSQMSHLSEGGGVLGLVTLENGTLNPALVRHVADNLCSKSQPHKCEPYRWGLNHLLLYFTSTAGYESLGKQFLEGKLDDCEGFKVTLIEPAVVCNPPKCFVQICSKDGEQLRDLLTKIVLPFSSAFTYMAIKDSSVAPAMNKAFSQNSAEVENSLVPFAGVLMLFDGANQSYALRTLETLSHWPWHRVTLSREATTVLGSDVKLYKLPNAAGPMWGFKTGCPFAGVQLLLLVQDAQKYEQMEKFYQSLIKTEPSRRPSGDGQQKETVIPLSERAELVLTLISGIKVAHLHNVSFHIQVDEVPKIAGLESTGSSQWKTRDPEGNTVVLFTPLK